MPLIKRLALAVAVGLLAFGGALLWGNDLIAALQGEDASVSHGSTSRGSLEQGKRLPSAGPNFKTYSRFGSLIGRTSVNSRVRSLLLASYGALNESRPELRFKIGETAWPSGGRFRPHRTHQNGLSVDFMVPVREGGRVSWLPTWPWLLFGYGINFDDEGRWEGLTIDFEAIALHLQSLATLAPDHGLAIGRVIFAVDLQPELHDAAPAPLKGFGFNSGQAWVRHDEHYHIDFVVVP